jgi:hypothetical protein
VIIADNIIRRHGPYWSDVSQAQYEIDQSIDTQRYIYFTNVVNHETHKYIVEILWPRMGLVWAVINDDVHTFEYNTQEYQELWGTRLGRATARLVLGAWLRGTHRIERIHIWAFLSSVQVRFDITELYLL